MSQTTSYQDPAATLYQGDSLDVLAELAPESVHCVGIKMGYADPPYVGQAKRHYSEQPDYVGEVNHAALIQRLMDEFSDGWALSCSSPSLRYLLGLCPSEVRIGAWVKPFASFKPGVGVAYACEPVIFYGGRPISRDKDTVRDWVSCNITLTRGIHGAKPDAFCYWLFQVLNLKANDEFCDLYPGSGAVTRAWEKWKGRLL